MILFSNKFVNLSRIVFLCFFSDLDNSLIFTLTASPEQILDNSLRFNSSFSNSFKSFTSIITFDNFIIE